jgi:hypothetical protein
MNSCTRDQGCEDRRESYDIAPKARNTVYELGAAPVKIQYLDMLDRSCAQLGASPSS